jgi:hypothetical protein
LLCRQNAGAARGRAKPAPADPIGVRIGALTTIQQEGDLCPKGKRLALIPTQVLNGLIISREGAG